MAIKISVLDQSPLYPGETYEAALAHTVQLAQKAEELGFQRFWVSEHHDSGQVAGSSPEVLISYLLARTNKIRVGSGGVMLQHYSPYKVAENFNVLATLAPGRVDLGIGRAPGGLPRSTQALQRGTGDTATLTDKIAEVAQHLDGGFSEGHPLAGLRATPLPLTAPQLFVLGASVGSAKSAAELGLPYAFSLFINGDEAQAAEAVQAYRETFERQAEEKGLAGLQPQIIVALSVVVAETEEEAAELAGSYKLVKIHLSSGKTLTVGSVEQAEEFARQSGEPYTIQELEPAVVKGTKATVRRKLLELQEIFGVEEFVFTTNIQPFAKRLRSFELLHEALAEVPAEA